MRRLCLALGFSGLTVVGSMTATTGKAVLVALASAGAIVVST